MSGVGGHGAYPQNTKDPIVLATRIVMALQTLVSRENDPLQPAVVTVGSFHAGTKHNIIPDEAKLPLTVRSYTPETRKLLLDGIRRIARGEAIAAGMPEDRMPTVEIEQPSAARRSTRDELTDHRCSCSARHFGAARVVETKPVMAGEDFSRFQLADKSQAEPDLLGRRRAAGELGRGQGRPAQLPSLHSPFWAPDADAVISTATEAMTVAALDVLEKDVSAWTRSGSRRSVPSPHPG